MNVSQLSYGQGKPIVFFHGWGFDHQIWLPLVPLLNNKYQLILVDLPGFGQTPMMDWGTFKTHLLANLPKQFAVSGWSLGGLYASRLAIEEPERVTSLVSVTSSPKFVADLSWPGVSKDVFSQFFANLSLNLQGTLNDFIALQTNKSKFSFNLGQLPSPQGLASGLQILDTWDLREGLKGLSQPACFMFGRLDPITPIKIMSTMQAKYPEFNYVLFKRAAHMPFLSDMDLFVDELVGFIQ